MYVIHIIVILTTTKNRTYKFIKFASHELISLTTRLLVQSLFKLKRSNHQNFALQALSWRHHLYDQKGRTCWIWQYSYMPTISVWRLASIQTSRQQPLMVYKCRWLPSPSLITCEGYMTLMAPIDKIQHSFCWRLGLTHCGQVTPYGRIEPGQNDSCCRLMASTITRTNVDSSSMITCGIHFRAT